MIKNKIIKIIKIKLFKIKIKMYLIYYKLQQLIYYKKLFNKQKMENGIFMMKKNNNGYNKVNNQPNKWKK